MSTLRRIFAILVGLVAMALSGVALSFAAAGSLVATFAHWFVEEDEEDEE